MLEAFVEIATVEDGDYLTLYRSLVEDDEEIVTDEIVLDRDTAIELANFIFKEIKFKEE